MANFHIFIFFTLLDTLIWYASSDKNSKNIGKTDFLKNAFEEMMKSYSDRNSLGKRPYHLVGPFGIGRLSQHWKKNPLAKGHITLWGFFTLKGWVRNDKNTLWKKALSFYGAFLHWKIESVLIENSYGKRPYE